MRRGRKIGVLAVGVTAVLGLGAAAWATTWTGNGTTAGACTDNTVDVGVPAGQQRWLFILTSPGPGPWTLTATFADSGTIQADGVQQGNGSVHFTVTTSTDDVLQSANAGPGTVHSVLTVSHCENGGTTTTSSSTTSSTSSTTSTTAPSGTTTTTGGVLSVPTFTG